VYWFWVSTAAEFFDGAEEVTTASQTSQAQREVLVILLLVAIKWSCPCIIEARELKKHSSQVSIFMWLFLQGFDVLYLL